MPLTKQDEADIRRILEDYLRLWMEGDAAGCADLYDESGDVLGVDGTFLRGPNEIREYYEDVMSGKYAGLTVKQLETVGIRSLVPDIALLDASWEVHGPAAAEGGETLIAATNCALVLTRRGDEWKISAARLMVPMQPMG